MDQSFSPSSPFLQSSSAEAWLFEQQLKGISFKGKVFTKLLAALGNPQEKRPVLHIAGTNGKGSVSAFLASLFQARGVRVGLYTSPHLIDFRERIRLQGEMISEEALEEGIARLQRTTRGWNVLPTFFELTTALAFDYFSRQECEVIILETGLGGRLDATNVAANKIACGITPISLDHQEWLGSTLAAIAREKAGIMRSSVPIVSAPQPPEVMQVLQEEAKRLKAPLTVVTNPISESIPLGLAGSYQRWNAALALQLAQQTPWALSEKEQEEGFRAVSWPGRFQRLPWLGHKLILDGAHNPAAIRQLVATWKELFPDQQCPLIFGALADKDWKTMLTLLRPICSEIGFVPVASPRSVTLAEMRAFFPQGTTFSSLTEALLKKSEKNLHPEKTPPVPILLTGSLFLVGQALSFLQGREYRSSMQ